MDRQRDSGWERGKQRQCEVTGKMELKRNRVENRETERRLKAQSKTKKRTTQPAS